MCLFELVQTNPLGGKDRVDTISRVILSTKLLCLITGCLLVLTRGRVSDRKNTQVKLMGHKPVGAIDYISEVQSKLDRSRFSNCAVSS